jgi:hypothetical protein
MTDQYTYRPDVLEAVLRHGVRPARHTPPQLVRDFVRELYKYELRRLRDRYVRREFPKPEYHVRVAELRDRYPVLALLARQWVQDPGETHDRD